MRIRPFALLIALVFVPAAAGAVIPEAVPDLPLLGEQARSGGLAVSAAGYETPATKVVDGSIEDWTGDITRFGGTAIYSRGEYVYQDFLGDDRGADDGADETRAAVTDRAAQIEPRAYRAEALAQALGEQLGADDIEGSGIGLPKEVAAPAYYGDAQYPAGLDAHADIEEVRVAADDENLSFLVRTAGMTVEPGTAIVISLLPVGDDMYTGTGGTTTRFTHDWLVIGDAVIHHRFEDTVTPCPCPGTAAATNAAGNTNAVEISIDRSIIFGPGPIFIPTPFPVGIAAGVSNATGTGLAEVAPDGAASDLINVAFRSFEPQRIWMDHDQALALRAGNIDDFRGGVDLDALENGYSETFAVRPGYYERVYVSDSPVNRESRSGQYWQGAFQHYGVYIPTTYRHGTLAPATWWMHYRGGHAHDAAAWVPGLIRQLGEQQGNIVITPSARGTSTWYVGRGHEDFLDVWDDAMSTFSIDPTRVYLSGYSMGGFASWFLGMVYPDRFAGAFPTAGATTQGGWVGAGAPISPQNGGDPEAELTFNLIENARNVPYVIYQGMADELVWYPGVARMATRFAELGYRHRLYSFPGAEHYTLAILDEWTEAARYLNGLRADPNPPRVTYRRWPAIEHAAETVQTPETLSYTFDGAYWIDGIVVRDVGTVAGGKPDPADWGTVDALTLGRGADETLLVPEAGTGGQIVPHAMTGLGWRKTGSRAPQNRFEATLTNVASARFDLARMAIGTSDSIDATVQTDGTAELHLAGSFPATVWVDGATVVSQTATELVLGFGAGTYDVRIRPFP